MGAKKRSLQINGLNVVGAAGSMPNWRRRALQIDRHKKAGTTG